MKYLVFIVGIILYIVTCIFIAKFNARVRIKLKGNIFFEYIAWILFIFIYIPYSFFFPAWLSESMELWQRTPDATMIMILFGAAISAIGIYKGEKISAP